MMKAIEVLRTSVRPVLTYALAFMVMYQVWQGQEIQTPLFQMNLITLAFWFGERAARNVLQAKSGQVYHGATEKSAPK